VPNITQANQNFFLHKVYKMSYTDEYVYRPILVRFAIVTVLSMLAIFGIATNLWSFLALVFGYAISEVIMFKLKTDQMTLYQCEKLLHQYEMDVLGI